jgi:hypothetical protein
VVRLFDAQCKHLGPTQCVAHTVLLPHKLTTTHPCCPAALHCCHQTHLTAMHGTSGRSQIGLRCTDLSHCVAASHTHWQNTLLLSCHLPLLPPLTDPPYGHAQNFRPEPELGRRVYAFHPSTGAVSVVAENFVMPK